MRILSQGIDGLYEVGPHTNHTITDPDDGKWKLGMVTGRNTSGSVDPTTSIEYEVLSTPKWTRDSTGKRRKVRPDCTIQLDVHGDGNLWFIDTFDGDWCRWWEAKT